MRCYNTCGLTIATFGRWIVDCGHPDFHSEIHAPLLMAVAKPAPPPAGVQGASEMTSTWIMSRPYTVSQKFAEGNFVNHLLAEIAKVEATSFGIPLSFRVEAHPTVFTTQPVRPTIGLFSEPSFSEFGSYTDTHSSSELSPIVWPSVIFADQFGSLSAGEKGAFV